MKNKTQFEAWYGYKSSLNFLKVFGCLCFTYVPQVKCDKLDKKAIQGIFVGYSTISKSYRFFQPQTMNIVISRDVHFVENEEWNWETLEDSNQASNQQKLNFHVGSVKGQRNQDWQNEMADNIPFRGTRLLYDIYHRCNIAVCEPVGFEEAKLDKNLVFAVSKSKRSVSCCA